MCSKVPTFCHVGVGPFLFGPHRKAVGEVVSRPVGGVSEPQGAGGQCSLAVLRRGAGEGLASPLCPGAALAQPGLPTGERLPPPAVAVGSVQTLPWA